jgi:HD superfamily phosphodiesterase
VLKIIVNDERTWRRHHEELAEVAKIWAAVDAVEAVVGGRNNMSVRVNVWAHKRARIGGTVLTAYALTLISIIKANHNKILLALSSTNSTVS